MIQNTITIFTLFILEALLSIDNAAVLAVMVKDLPGDQGKKALKYGLIGAYALRGLCLLIAGWLVALWWLKVLGGLYLLYLTYGFFTKSDDTLQEDLSGGRQNSKIYKWCQIKFGLSDFWLTIILVEIMDLSFSLDNIFAAVAMSPHMWVIVVGVFMGIAAMRFVAGGFMKLMNQYPFLEKSAFIVIGFLGLKLVLSGIAKGLDWYAINSVMERHTTDLIFSACLMIIFFLPILQNKFSKN